jgi:hypothetical protein
LAKEAENQGNGRGHADTQASDAAAEGTSEGAEREVTGAPSPDLGSFRNARLRGNFIIESISIAEGQLGAGGGSLGQTAMDMGTERMSIRIAAGQTPYEPSVAIHHEVLEATALQAEEPPSMVLDLSEEDLDLLAYLAQEQFGTVTVENLNKLLAVLGYGHGPL